MPEYDTTNVRLRSSQWDACKTWATAYAKLKGVRKQSATDVLDEAVERGLKSIRVELNADSVTS